MSQIGIYLITNNCNGKKYVGQSINIPRRYAEHLRSGQPDKYNIKNKKDLKLPIHMAMQKYGIENFTLSILELCDKSKLNEREKFWIKKLNTNDKNCGYNLTEGGQDNFQLSGELHSQAKLTQQEVNNIKLLLQENKLSLTEINGLYPKISKSTISMINQGKVWKDKNLNYPLRPTNFGSAGSKNPRAKLNETEVQKIRLMQSKGMKLADIANQYPQVSQSTIKAIYYGQSFKHLPVWDIKNKKWK